MRPHQRGFFCDDDSLRYPYTECTISVPMLSLCVVAMPLLFIAVVEVIRVCNDFQLRRYLRNLWPRAAAFSFGFLATYLCTELTKRLVGRLRPHFFAACQPRLADGSRCDDPDPDPHQATGLRRRYIEHYECTNRQLTTEQLLELQVSFPSAHASLSFYAMVFLCFYVHAVWRSRGSSACRFLRHLLQFALLMLAWSVAISRVVDYWHHWSDVLAGGLLGVAFALLSALYVGGLLRPLDRRPARTRHRSQHQHQQQQQQLVQSPSDWKLQTVLTT